MIKMKTPESYIIRPLMVDDLAAMAKIETSAHSHPWSLANLADCFGPLHHGIGLFVAQESMPGTLVGFSLVQQIVDEVSLLDICIAPEHQGQGLGRQLMAQLIRDAISREALVIMLEVRESNLGAIHLYQSLGFVEVSRRKNYYQTPIGNEDAILMDLALV
jgi:[ribosomal protein S18]-alanine N-acetyltransferase